MNKTKSNINEKEAFLAYLLRLADDKLILGQRVSEWCGHGPELEEDLALSNIALDLIGHATALYELAAETEGKGNDEDYFAFFRDDEDFTNLQLYELPNGDFAFTIARLFLYSSFNYFLYEALKTSEHVQFKGMIEKHLKELKYHLRHTRTWVLRLGDGTEESRSRIQNAFNELWMYVDELFYMDEVDEMAINSGNGADTLAFKTKWKELIENTLTEATLEIPDWEQFSISGSRNGLHTEYLGHILSTMQFLRRSHPDGVWK